MTALNRSCVRVIGGGLAGTEAAWQLAQAGLNVSLHEMKPHKRTPAAQSDHLAELVCSNSFRSAREANAVGLLKAEMAQAGGLIMACAQVAKVPAGDALAVDRDVFAAEVERRILSHPRITMVREELTALPADDVATIIATGPLTAEPLASAIAEACGRDRLAFYDAIAPIVEADSIHTTGPGAAYFKSRWDKGDGDDYLNCPLTKPEYDAFLAALLEADQVSARDFEDLHYFEGCLPLEVIASRGEQTLTFGCMKPVGLNHPETGEQFHAVLQLRKENVHGTAYNLVGCQTRLKQPDQKRVLGLIPALRDAKFLRYGAMHRNTYIDAPALLDDTFALKSWPTQNIFFAGQITGVEGYVESTACGLLVAWTLLDKLSGKPADLPPETTTLGGLYRHTRGLLRAKPTAPYEPANVMWSMVPPMRIKAPKRVRKEKQLARAKADYAAWLRARREAGRFVAEPLD